MVLAAFAAIVGINLFQQAGQAFQQVLAAAFASGGHKLRNDGDRHTE